MSETGAPAADGPTSTYGGRVDFSRPLTPAPAAAIDHGGAPGSSERARERGDRGDALVAFLEAVCGPALRALFFAEATARPDFVAMVDTLVWSEMT